jgi:RimJ/RimL family protein N-acetyltransferase
MYAIPAGDKTEMVGQYIMHKVPGLRLIPGSYAAFAFLADNGDFAGGAVVSNFRQGQYGNDCEISCAAETAMAFRPGVCTAVFRYVFVQLGCTRLTAITTKKNRRTRAFLERLGFALEGCVRRAYDGRKSALIYGLLAEDCRYLGAGASGGIDGEEVRASGTDAA